MKVQALLLLLLVTGAAAQNETDNQTVDEEPPPAGDGFDLRLAISVAAVVFLVGAFVYVAKR